LSPEQIRKVVMANVSAFQGCYEIELVKDPELKGGVAVAFQVGTEGSVVDAHVSSSSIGNPRIEGCMLETFKRLKFPRADVRTSAVFPFVFKGRR
jgi:outer membrane biosynthesis protein TonB